MPIPYQHKRSTAAGVEPTTLQDGEIAINVAAADPKIFFKDSASTIRAFSLASYASATHSHVVADVTDFTTKANVVSVNGITGVVSLSHTSVSAAAASHVHAASDVTSGEFDIARIPTIGYTALSGVPTTFAPSAHTHVAADVTNLTSVANVVSVNGLTGSVVLTNASVSAASASHSHVAADITDFATEAAKYGPVTSVNSLTGTIVLTSLGVSAASAVHSHVAADITNFTSVANVVSVNAKTGVVSISHTDVTAASASHTHAASDITSGTFDAARLPLATTGAAGAVIVGTGLGVSSGTVSVTYGTNSTSACRGDDSRLSDTRTPTDGSVTTAKIANDAVTYAKIQNVSATDRLLGRSSAGSGDVEEITCGSFGRSLIGSADAAAARTTLSVQPTASPAFTGAATFRRDEATSGTAYSAAVQLTNGQNWGYGVGLDFANPAVSGGAIAVTSAIVSDYDSDSNFSLRFHTMSGGTTAERVRISANGALIVGAGSASACGVAFSGDPNTGLAQISGADTLSLVASGAERLIVGSSNRVFVNGNGEQFGFGVKYVNTGGPVYFGATSNSATPDAAIAGAGGNTLLLAKNDGEVIVGGTTDQGAYNLQCNGTGVWGAGAYTNGSDERIKDDITPLGEATSVITAMQPVTFRYKRTWSSDQSIQPGFLAQQLQEALAGTPYLAGVVQQGTEYLSVAYQSLIPLLVKALQESNARIAALEERLNHA